MEVFKGKETASLSPPSEVNPGTVWLPCQNALVGSLAVTSSCLHSELLRYNDTFVFAMHFFNSTFLTTVMQ